MINILRRLLVVVCLSVIIIVSAIVVILTPIIYIINGNAEPANFIIDKFSDILDYVNPDE